MKNLQEMILLQNHMKEIRQISKIEAVTKGGVDGFTILNGGTGYKVGDTTEFR